MIYDFQIFLVLTFKRFIKTPIKQKGSDISYINLDFIMHLVQKTVMAFMMQKIIAQISPDLKNLQVALILTKMEYQTVRTVALTLPD